MNERLSMKLLCMKPEKAYEGHECHECHSHYKLLLRFHAQNVWFLVAPLAAQAVRKLFPCPFPFLPSFLPSLGYLVPCFFSARSSHMFPSQRLLAERVHFPRASERAQATKAAAAATENVIARVVLWEQKWPHLHSSTCGRVS